MTINRSEAEIVREVADMKPDQITDAYALDLHTRHMRAAGRRDDTTIRGRRGAIERLTKQLDPHGDNPRAVIDANSDQLAEWQASQAHLASKTISCYVNHVQMYYRWLVRPMRILTESPADDLITPIVPSRLPRPIAEDDLQFALDACTDELVRAWLILGAYAGLRSIDVSDLDVGDVLTDRDIPMLRVRGKGDRERTVIVGHEVISALLPYTAGRRRGPLFAYSDGRRISRRAISRAVNKYLRGIGLDEYTFHQSRHRYGTKLYELTRDIRFTQKQMRHKSLSSTELYVQVPTDKAAKSVKALDAELANRPRGRRPRRDLST